MSNCWNWHRGKSAAGYGQCYFNGKRVYAHRLAKVIFDNLDHSLLSDPNIVVLHECDNPACVNPAHLRVGTQIDNVIDRDIKGRVRHGSKHPVAKLTESDVLEIRSMVRRRKELSLHKQDIAKCYNISPSTLTAIINRTTWKRI